jgi:hypothetical protein
MPDNPDSTVPYGQTKAGKYQQQQQTSVNQAIQNVAASQQNLSGLGVTGGLGSTNPMQYPKAPTANAKDPLVYMGAGSQIAYLPASQASAAVFQWDSQTENKFKSQLALAGYDLSGMDQQKIAQLWSQYVNLAANYSLNGQDLSPWQVLQKDIATHESVQPRTVMSQTKQYNISTYEDAFGLYEKVAQNLLGRNPTKAETASFQKILNQYEYAHPTTTTWQSTYMGSQLQDRQATKTTGGVTAQAQAAIAEEQAKQDPEYGAYQAATNGMNWLMKAIGGGG